ncbi:alpha-amylase family glycosyl hydrolase [Asanoa sp. NPDC049573]|uniref:alpha-amylase family glycosyl hydrolase n=1 Tax=Asanoa sp. NPDC049573 TaxID=3155396 RepID=UPI003446140B
MTEPRRNGPAWLSDAVLYQIYPQSFADSNGDGIGDLAGVLDRLDYLRWLGVDTVWFSPCFRSPFADAGYDVSDYLSIAPRYGTNDDLVAVTEAARERGIRIMLDLVAGHTSDQHPWFRAWADDPDDDRFIWSPKVGSPAGAWAPVPGKRGGYFMLNFYPCQPALNFGYARDNPREPWRQAVDAPGPRANREALREIMAFWFDRGVSGFRVDMAASLVKDDPGYVETGKLWGEMRAWMDRAYPDNVLIPEWGDPAVAVPAGFHADFFLHFRGTALRSLWHLGIGTADPSWSTGPAYFDAEGLGAITEFVNQWQTAAEVIAGAGQIALPTSNHDYARLVTGTRAREHVGAAFAFLMTWPTLPTIYFGDEIGMRYIPDLPDKEGSMLAPVNNRTGSRTPMQWDSSPNAGFSTAPADQLYLPIDPDPARPTVAAQRADEGSLLHLVRRLITLRRATPALGSKAGVEVLHSGYPFVYTRGGTHLVAINPRRAPAAAPLPAGLVGESVRALEVHGARLAESEVKVDGFGYGIYEL